MCIRDRFGCGEGSTINPPDNNRYFHLQKAAIVWPDWNARGLYIDFWMLGDAARELPDDSWQKNRARTIANKCMDLFDPMDRASAVSYTHLDVYKRQVMNVALPWQVLLHTSITVVTRRRHFPPDPV